MEDNQLDELEKICEDHVKTLYSYTYKEYRTFSIDGTVTKRVYENSESKQQYMMYKDLFEYIKAVRKMQKKEI